MDPTDGAVARFASEHAGTAPSADDKVVQRLVGDLDSALEGCTDCWIHNALTVSLNPFLTVALTILIKRRCAIRWVAWSADISSLSRFVDGSCEATVSRVREIEDFVAWVAISRTRRGELNAALGVPAARIQVVNPPLDVLSWLDVGSQTRSIVGAVNLLPAGLVVVVPSKALPHKRLDRAVSMGAALAHAGHDARVLISAAPSPHDPRLSEAVVQRLRASIRLEGVEPVVVLLPDLLADIPTDRTIRELMQLCDVVFLPSIEEGFGMPVREAAALGVPIVCTDIPVFREVAGNAAAYFGEGWNDYQVASLVYTVASARRNPARQAALASVIRFRLDLEELLRTTAQPKV
jgi:glycosyltransferase involved in cell wall biosynthesis